VTNTVLGARYGIEFDADMLEAIAVIDSSVPLMSAITSLAQSKATVCGDATRNAMFAGNLHQAALFEGQARAWEELPQIIRELAIQWAQKGALRKAS
jgi:hypothetical protein